MMCLYEQNAYTLEPGKVQVRTFQVGKTIVLLTQEMPFFLISQEFLIFTNLNGQ